MRISPQAQRRLVRTLTRGELVDLANDITDALEAEGFQLGPDDEGRAIVFRVLTREV